MPTYYKRNTNPTNNNWNQADNWSTVSSTSATNTGTFPQSATLDPVIFDANSIQVTVNIAATCTSLNFTGYTNTITMTNGITVGGSVTLSAGMTIAGAGNLTITNTSTLTSNGKTWPNSLIFDNSFTATLADNWTISGTLQKNTTRSVTMNGFQMQIGGGLNLGTGGTGYFLGGTTNLILNGTGTWQGTEECRNNLEINTTGTITVSGTVRYGSGTASITLKYTAGTLITTGSTLQLNRNCTLDLQNTTWGSLGLEANTYTLSSDITLSSALNVATTTSPIINGFKIYVGGNFSAGTGSGYFTTGTTEIVLNGTGTWTGGDTRNTLTINTAGTITLSGTIIYGLSGRTLTYTAGTINPGTSTFQTAAGLTYSIASPGNFTLWNFSPLTGTHTINTGTITVNNNMTFNGNTTFAGTGGWTANNLTDSTAGRILTLKDGSTYTVTGTLSLTGTNASRWTIASSSATLRALLTLNQGASQSLIYVNGTRIDSSAGQTVWSLGGTLTDTVNWNNGSRPAPFNSIRMG